MSLPFASCLFPNSGAKVYGKFRSHKFFYDNFRSKIRGGRFFEKKVLSISVLGLGRGVRRSGLWRVPRRPEAAYTAGFPARSCTLLRAGKPAKHRCMSRFRHSSKQPFSTWLNLHVPRQPFFRFFCGPFSVPFGQ
jgi:hypothetical protein